MSKSNNSIAQLPSSNVAPVSTAIVQNVNIADVIGFNPFEGFEKEGFEDQSFEFFKPEEQGLTGVEVPLFLQQVIKMNIKDKEETFVKAYLQMADGYKVLYCGQAQILAAFTRNDKGKGVLAKVTFKGKVQIKGTAKTMNDFVIETKSC